MGLNVVYDTPFDSNVDIILHFNVEWKNSSTSIGVCNILKVKWKGIVYKVTEQLPPWHSREGDNLRINYNVRTGKKRMFQFQWDLVSLKWTLIKCNDDINFR